MTIPFLEIPTAAADVVEFTVPGAPAPQGSKRAFVVKGRPVLAESSKAVGPWRERIAIAAHQAMGERKLFPGPITLTADFVMPRPKSAPKRRTPAAVKRPDLDKLLRVFDALTGICWNDDSQVTEIHATKRIAEPGETPGVTVRIDHQP